MTLHQIEAEVAVQIQLRRVWIKNRRNQLQLAVTDMLGSSIDCRSFTQGISDIVRQLQAAEGQLEVLLDLKNLKAT